MGCSLNPSRTSWQLLLGGFLFGVSIQSQPADREPPTGEQKAAKMGGVTERWDENQKENSSGPNAALLCLVRMSNKVLICRGRQA